MEGRGTGRESIRWRGSRHGGMRGSGGCRGTGHRMWSMCMCVCVCVYVCMYVCVYVCVCVVYVYVYACMDVCRERAMAGGKGRFLLGWMGKCDVGLHGLFFKAERQTGRQTDGQTNGNGAWSAWRKDWGGAGIQD